MSLQFSPTAMRLPASYGGGMVDFLNPDTATINFDFIAARLSSARRFGGHPRALTVAQHSSFVSAAMEASGFPPGIVLAAHLHDAHEAYTGDLISPLRAAVRELAGKDVITAIQNVLDVSIFSAAGIRILARDAATEIAVRDYDLRSRHNELVDVMGEDASQWRDCDRPRITSMPIAAYAADDDGGRAMWIARLNQLMGGT